MTTSTALFSARALVDELARGGVRSVCIAPGSRSTALALAVAERSDFAPSVLTDERSMGFFALGIARATREPVALVCTSGTAAANLMPAVIEADLGGGALVLLTADRPPELRDCGAPQTIHQAGLFGRHVRWSADLPLLDATTAGARALRSFASRAVATARIGRGGPVHLNVPLREPFTDASFPLAVRFDTAGRDDGRPFTGLACASSLSSSDGAAIARRLSEAARGVIVCAGPELPAAPIATLARALGWPIVGDPMSGLRFGAHDRSQVIDAGEVLLRDEALRARLRPDCILRFGLTPAPRSLQRWMEESWPAEHIVVAGDGNDAWADPVHAASTIVRSDAASFCAAVASLCDTAPSLGHSTASSTDAAASFGDAVAAAPGGAAKPADAWLQQWLSMSATARANLDAGLDAEAVLFDGIVLRAVAEALPEAATLVVGNSMPVRDADAFLAGSDKSLRVFANRGASGIDGVLSTALGIAASSSGPTVLVVGDLSFLHDAAALATAARLEIPLLIVVVNNDGGGIFSFLPLHDALPAGSDVFERYFGTPHGVDLKKVAATAGGFFARIDERTTLAATIRAGLEAASGGPAVVEVRTDRDAGRRAHLAIVAAAQTAATRELDAAPAITATPDLHERKTA
jgi:2-succinyl-5-enolpyruvyl-6-hydroxy-3-cyclohexene-1-carboxylate synthase